MDWIMTPVFSVTASSSYAPINVKPAGGEAGHRAGI